MPITADQTQALLTNMQALDNRSISWIRDRQNIRRDLIDMAVVLPLLASQ